MDSPPLSPDFNPLTFSEELTPLPELKEAGDTVIDFDGQLPRSLDLREDVRTGCGGQTWPAGMVLGKHLLRYHRKEMESARIVELGAGGGLVGLAVAVGCELQHTMYITDQLEMLELLQHNIALNKVEDRAQGMILNWGEPLPDIIVQQKPDAIIAAECVYFEPAFPLLQQTLKDLFELNSEAVVYFCFKKRRRADMQFLKAAKKMFFVEESFDEDRLVFSRLSLFLFTFRSKHSAAAQKAKAEAKASKDLEKAAARPIETKA